MSSRQPKVRTEEFSVARAAMVEWLHPWFLATGMVHDGEEILTMATDGGLETRINIKLTIKKKLEVKYIKLDGT